MIRLKYHRRRRKKRIKKRKRVNKKQKKVLFAIGIIVILIITLLCSLNVVFRSFMPSVTTSMLEDYKRSAQIVGCTWQELVAYDTVRFENDFDDINPYLSAVDFLKLHYETWELAESDGKQSWVKTLDTMIVEKEDMCDWLGENINSSIKQIISHQGKRENEKIIIQISFLVKDLDELIIEKSFSKEQTEWIGSLMSSGKLDEMFGDVYVLPDYIESAQNSYFGWPTPELNTITSEFSAVRKHPVFGIKRPHNGVDISGNNAMGAIVCSIDDGIVTQVNLNGGERGINIKIQHHIEDDIWISRYQHLSAVNVYVGQKVYKGTEIGAVGNTGIGTGPHLHIELTYNGVLIDPLPLIR